MEDVIDRLRTSGRKLPPRLADAARFVAANAFDSATTPMRGLAQRAGHSPATFTRLAQTLGYTGWEELRGALVEIARPERGSAPYSTRPLPQRGAQALTTEAISADLAAVARIDPDGLAAAAALLESAPRVFVAGFRSCYASAHLFHYLYRLFRPEVALLGSAGSLLDLELGGLRADDAVVMICFEPYSRDLLLTARAARDAGCATIAVVDDRSAPIATDASLTLLHGTATPSFFPSLTACTALLQALAALLYVRSGQAGRTALRRAEARIEAHTAYVVTGETIHESPRPSQPAQRPGSRRRRRGDTSPPR